MLGGRDEPDLGEFADLDGALKSVPWRPRTRQDHVPDHVDCLLDWRPDKAGDQAPDDAEVWYDMAESFDVPAHGARLVIRKTLGVSEGREVAIGKPRQGYAPAPLRPRANYQDGEYKEMRNQRLRQDQHLCVFCKAPATTVQHTTYRHAGGDERIEELRSLCRLCHDAVTMMEYGQNMGLDRINPEEPYWRDQIIKMRDEIIAFRSLETRRRRLRPEEVE